MKRENIHMKSNAASALSALTDALHHFIQEQHGCRVEMAVLLIAEDGAIGAMTGAHLDPHIFQPAFNRMISERHTAEISTDGVHDEAERRLQ